VHLREFPTWILAVFGLISTPAVAANWVQIGSANGEKFLIDTTSLYQVGSYSAVWQKRVYPPGKEYAEVMNLMYFDCPRHLQVLKSTTAYNERGEVIDSETIEDYQMKWKPIIPESIGETFYVAACQVLPKAGAGD